MFTTMFFGLSDVAVPGSRAPRTSERDAGKSSETR